MSSMVLFFNLDFVLGAGPEVELLSSEAPPALVDEPSAGSAVVDAPVVVVFSACVDVGAADSENDGAAVALVAGGFEVPSTEDIGVSFVVGCFEVEKRFADVGGAVDAVIAGPAPDCCDALDAGGFWVKRLPD